MEINKNFLKDFLHDDIINLGFDEDSIDIALEAFYESFENSFPSLLSSINSKRMEDIQFHAHALKGTFYNFQNEQFKEMSELFKNIEFAAKENKNFSTIQENFDKIKELSKNWLKIN